ncbi:MAG: FAD:protein FMN transferase [Prevotella sp.]|nr:FAD:protein FMN transferase [Prevotella sp.]
MTKKKLVFQILFLLLLIVGTVLIVKQNASLPYVKNQGRVFGTYYHATYQAERDMQQLIEEELRKVDSEFSMFNDTSTVSHINRNEETALSEMFLEVFGLAERINSETSGAFDVTVAPLVNAWGFGFKSSEFPSDEVVDSLRLFVGQQGVKVAKKGAKSVLTKADSRTMLDFSAVAKGYGCDVVARMFRSRGVKNFLIEIGGEIVASGVNPDRKQWSVGVNKPVEDIAQNINELDTVLTITDCAMATSGNYRNFYERDGKKYAHTIDPHTGRPVSHSLLSATVIAPSCAVADAYATAFMVMGEERARQLLEKHRELRALFICAGDDGAHRIWQNISRK